MFSSIFKSSKSTPPVQSTAPQGFSHIFKDSAASKKAWLSRERKPHMFEGKAVIDSGDYKGWIPIKHDGKKWVRADGKELDKAQKERLSMVATPPGWDNVMLAPDLNQSNITRGSDAKGKWQPKQNPAFKERQDAAKWERVHSFHKKAMKPITQAAERLMTDETKSPQERDLGAVIHMVARTGFRIGSNEDTGAEAQAYGASTLEKSHIKLKAGSKISFEFVGKKGVNITKELQDKPLHEYLSERLKTLKPKDKVFDVSNTQALAFVKKASGDGQYKTKDFRTWNGTAVALALRKRLPAPKTSKEWTETQKQISEVVAQHLGNTPTVALRDYIAPYIFNKWDQSLKPPEKAKKAEEELNDFWEGAVDGPWFPYDEMMEAMDEEVEEDPPKAMKPYAGDGNPLYKSEGLSSIFKDAEASRRAWKVRAKRTPTDLDERLVDYKPDRSLEGKGTSKIRDILPEVDHIAYSKTPFIEKMHELMGVKDPMTHDVEDYMKRRDDLFKGQKIKVVPYDKVVVTQARVNDARVQQLIDDPSTGGKHPVQTVRHGGKTYIMNGHHRVVAELKQGAKGVESAVLDLTDVKKGEVALEEARPFRSTSLTAVFKDSAASVKAWITRKKTFKPEMAQSIDAALNANEKLGVQYYATRAKYGKDHPNTTAAYAEWEKSKDALTQGYGYSKNSIADLSLKAKKLQESDAAAAKQYKDNALADYTAAIKQHGLGSDEASQAEDLAVQYGAKPDDVKAALMKASTFIPAPKPATAMGGSKGNAPKSKAGLMQAYLASLHQAPGHKKALEEAIAQAEDAGLTKGQMAAMKAHATMAYKKNKAFVDSGGTPGSNAPAAKSVSVGDAKTDGFANLLSDKSVYQKMRAHGEEVVKSYTEAERNAVSSWIGSGYHDMNKIINGQESQMTYPYKLDEFKDHLKNLGTALDRPLGTDVALRRNMAQKWFFKAMGLPHSDLNAMYDIPEEQLATLIGKKYTEKAPSSTTYNTSSPIGFSNTAAISGGLKMVINAPKTAKGLFIDSFNVSGEQEVLLKGGATYVIRKIVKAPTKQYGKATAHTVYVDLIGNTP